MNEHLTHQELTDHLLGTRSATVEAHLSTCSACSKELYQFRESLGTFRSAVRNWSEAERGLITPPSSLISRITSPGVRCERG